MSRICAISDIHGDLSLLHKVKEYIEANNIADLILMGDYSSSIGNLDENREDIKSIVNTIGEDANLYAVPGNCDALDSLKILRSFGIDYHNKAVRIGDYTVLLYGGSNPTPFGTPWEVEEGIIRKDLEKLFFEHPEGRHLLIVHTPPKNTSCDMIPSGVHVGSEAVRQIIEKFSPEIVLCSHIHECAGRTDTIGKSEIINVGMLKQGNFAEISPEGAEHKTLE